MPDLEFARLNDELFDALVHRQSVQAVISRAYACIGLPIIAFDVSFKLLGYAFPRPFGYPYWEQIAAQGQLSTDVIDGEGTLNYQEMMYSNRKSKVFDWGTAKDFPQVDGPIMQGGSLVGYVGIGIQGYRDIDGLLEANDLLADVLAVSLRDSVRDTDAADSLRRAAESLLLLDQAPGDTRQQITAAYPPSYVFAVLASDNSRVSTLQYIKSILCSEENSALGALSKDCCLYVLFYRVGQDTDLSCIQAMLREIAAKYGFSGGVSDFFFDTEEITAHRMQSMLAMTMGRGRPEGRDVCTFREYYGSIVCCSAAESIGETVCALPAIEKLAGLDAAEGTEYLPTLRAYLDTFQDRTAAANQLKIHKNTVLYRIRRIEEILDMDLRDFACAGRLDLGLQFYDLRHREVSEEAV